jgi:Effector protein
MKEYSNVNSIQIVGTLQSRNGNTDVTVVREGFEEDVVKVLDSMWTSQTGGAVLRILDSLPGDIYIVPRPGSPNEIIDSEQLGQGLRSTVPFEPAAWPKQANTLNACEVLLHELVHSVRQLSGKLNQRPTHDSYEDIEEFYAIVVANVYRSELHRVGLRGGHHFESLPPKQRDDAGVFLKTGENRKRLENLKGENGDLFKAISDVLNAKWNPFRLITYAGKKR